MKNKSTKVRKNIIVDPFLVKRARKILNASSDSQAIEICLKSLTDRKTNEEVWEATKKFIRNAYNPNFKPLFS
ncbi:MAG: hypothetical protein HY094_09000 [Candidatus Melainabacteria bacterium]|nr:hypothetical protein [Candidatus Melainabacteria bacterium]